MMKMNEKVSRCTKVAFFFALIFANVIGVNAASMKVAPSWSVGPTSNESGASASGTIRTEEVYTQGEMITGSASVSVSCSAEDYNNCIKYMNTDFKKTVQAVCWDKIQGANKNKKGCTYNACTSLSITGVSWGYGTSGNGSYNAGMTGTKFALSVGVCAVASYNLESTQYYAENTCPVKYTCSGSVDITDSGYNINASYHATGTPVTCKKCNERIGAQAPELDVQVTGGYAGGWNYSAHESPSPNWGYGSPANTNGKFSPSGGSLGYGDSTTGWWVAKGPGFITAKLCGQLYSFTVAGGSTVSPSTGLTCSNLPPGISVGGSLSGYSSGSTASRSSEKEDANKKETITSENDTYCKAAGLTCKCDPPAPSFPTGGCGTNCEHKGDPQDYFFRTFAGNDMGNYYKNNMTGVANEEDSTLARFVYSAKEKDLLNIMFPDRVNNMGLNWQDWFKTNTEKKLKIITDTYTRQPEYSILITPEVRATITSYNSKHNYKNKINEDGTSDLLKTLKEKYNGEEYVQDSKGYTQPGTKISFYAWGCGPETSSTLKGTKGWCAK